MLERVCVSEREAGREGRRERERKEENKDCQAVM